MTIDTIVENGINSLKRLGTRTLVYGMILLAGMNSTGFYDGSAISLAEAKSKTTMRAGSGLSRPPPPKPTPEMPLKQSPKPKKHAQLRCRQNLKKLVLVLDPGHGEWFPNYQGGAAFDPGTHRKIYDKQKKRIVGTFHEAPVSWDLCMRIKKEVERRGGKVVLTLEYKVPEMNDIAENFKPENNAYRDDLDLHAKQRVVAGSDVYSVRTFSQAMQARVEVANRAWKKYHDHALVKMISVHFDALVNSSKYARITARKKGKRVIIRKEPLYFEPNAMPYFLIGKGSRAVNGKEQTESQYNISGPRILTYRGIEHDLAAAVSDSFCNNRKYWRTGNKIGRTIQERRGGLYIVNPVHYHNNSDLDPMLIEVGNMANNSDYFRIRAPRERQELAELIVKGLVHYMERKGLATK